MRPVERELSMLKPLIDLYGEPNICFNIYKNRDGDLGEFKVWCRVNLGNYDLEELFLTDWNYRPFKEKIEKVYLHSVVEDEFTTELETNTVHIMEDDDLPVFDEETGEIIEEVQKPRGIRRSRS